MKYSLAFRQMVFLFLVGNEELDGKVTTTWQEKFHTLHNNFGLLLGLDFHYSDFLNILGLLNF